MAEQLNVQQVLLLNNLMYIPQDPPLRDVIDSENKTVKELISEIYVSKLEANKDYGSYMTGDDWKNIITAIKKDEQLLDMKIVSIHIDKGGNGGGGVSAVFVDPSTNEAVVAFRGTASQEWKDNFTGGGPTDATDGISTFQQQNALEWYQSLDLDQYHSITVTGHSKGGNKAKYITIMDDSVDRCLSFDGQGFSDEFIKQYSDKIATNQDKILNNNVESDYVNLLLNDIGNTTFYKGYDYGKGGFLENHCPNTFFKVNTDGTFQMNVGTKDERMTVVDEFLNNYLRTLSPEDKKDTLLMIGKLVEKGFNGADSNELFDVLLSGDNIDYAGNLAAYLLVYKKEHPEIVETLNDVLNEMKMEDLTKIIDVVDGITDWKYFNKIMDGLGWVSGKIPNFMYDLLRDYLEKKGISLSVEDLKKLFGMLQIMADDMDDIEIADNGGDLRIPSRPKNAQSESNKTRTFSVHTEKLSGIDTELAKSYKELMDYAVTIQGISNYLGSDFYGIKQSLMLLRKNILQQATQLKCMEEALVKISTCYQMSEEKIMLGTLACDI